MKILTGMFLLIGFSIMLIGGIAGIQSIINVGDTVINESSDNYEAYETLKNTSTSTMYFAGQIPWILIILVFVALAVMMAGAVYMVTHL